jgi:opacity protein-like surface antigen|tara:strand:- start:136 stop:849 length:714 start_codon:yes stop_codon:yes gene_type:complete
MNKLNKYFVSTILATMFAAGSVFAGETYSGFSIGIVGNNAEYDTKGKEIEGTGDGEVTPGQATQAVDFPSFFLEYTRGDVGGGVSMTFGAEFIPDKESIGSKSRTDTTDSSEDSSDSGTYTAKGEVKNAVSAYIEPGYMFNDYIGFYGKAGVSHVKVVSLEDIALGASSSEYGDQNVLGGMLGGGIKLITPWGLFTKLEYTETKFEKVVLKSTSGGQNEIHASPTMSAIRLNLGWNF